MQPAKVAQFEQLASVEYSYLDPAATQLAYEKLFKGWVLHNLGHGITAEAKIDTA